MSDDKTPKEQIHLELYHLIDAAMSHPILSSLGKFRKKRIDSWDVAEKIIDVLEKYIDSKIDERLGDD